MAKIETPFVDRWVYPAACRGYIGSRTVAQIDALAPASGDSCVAADAGTPAAGASSVLVAGDLTEYDGTQWIKIVSAAAGFPPVGTRAVVHVDAVTLFAPLTEAADEGKVAEWDGASLTPTLTTPADGEMIAINGEASVVENKSYQYDGAPPSGLWVQTGGAGMSPVAHAASHTDGTDDVAVAVGDSGAGGTKGLVPAPAAGDAAKVLTGAMTYVEQAGGLSAAESFGRKNWGILTAHSNTSSFSGEGQHRILTITDASSSSVTTADGVRLLQVSTGTTNSVAGWDNADTHFNFASKIEMWFKIQIEDVITSVRYTVGACQDGIQGGGEAGSSDDATKEYAVIQFSTARGDSNWQFTTRDDGGTQEITDLGAAAVVTVDTVYVVKFVSTGASWTVTIYDETGAQLATATHSTNIPDVSNALVMGAVATTLENVAKKLGTFTSSIENSGQWPV